ncbi:MAG TPA: cytochrome c [Patescibacteria group bacterium]|nr:cytochrome c [Patescibacteria group bacterium]
MRSRTISLALVVVALPLALFARQESRPVSLNPMQFEGRRIFDQRCGICHASLGAAVVGGKRYAVALNEDLVDGHEKVMAGIIRNGVPEMMPGFKYTLTDSQIDAIVDYLKTVPKQTGRGHATNQMD